MIDTGNKRFSEKAPDLEQVLNLEEIKEKQSITGSINMESEDQ